MLYFFISTLDLLSSTIAHTRTTRSTRIAGEWERTRWPRWTEPGAWKPRRWSGWTWLPEIYWVIRDLWPSYSCTVKVNCLLRELSNRLGVCMLSMADMPSPRMPRSRVTTNSPARMGADTNPMQSYTSPYSGRPLSLERTVWICFCIFSWEWVVRRASFSFRNAFHFSPTQTGVQIFARNC